MAVEQSWKGGEAKRMVQRAGSKGILAVGLAIERQATSLTPVDTGNLRGSLATQKDGDGVIVGTNVDYAPFVEYGTSRSSAQPYLRPAIDIIRGRAPEIVAEEGKREFRL